MDLSYVLCLDDFRLHTLILFGDKPTLVIDDLSVSDNIRTPDKLSTACSEFMLTKVADRWDEVLGTGVRYYRSHSPPSRD